MFAVTTKVPPIPDDLPEITDGLRLTFVVAPAEGCPETKIDEYPEIKVTDRSMHAMTAMQIDSLIFDLIFIATASSSCVRKFVSLVIQSSLNKLFRN
jgi:hypothetical protein